MPKKAPSNVATKSAPKSRKPRELARTDSDNAEVLAALDATHASREKIRKQVESATDVRKRQPLDMELIRPLVHPDYESVFNSAMESGAERVIIIDLCQGTPTGAGVSVESFDFLNGFMKANTINRRIREKHVVVLSEDFRADFMPSATHWVLTSEGMVANAGHSSRAVAIAFYPPEIDWGVIGVRTIGEDKSPIKADSVEGKARLESSDGFYFIDDEGYVKSSTQIANPSYCRVGCVKEGDAQTSLATTNDDGTTNVDWTIPEGHTAPESLLIHLTINADPRSCLKMDDVRISATFEDQLSMVPQINSHLENVHSDLRKYIGETLRMWYLRQNHSSEGYGFLSKGGRLNKADVQFWYLTSIASLLDCQARLKKSEDTIHPIPPFMRAEGNEKGGAKTYHLLCAMMVLDAAGRQRIVDKAVLMTAANRADWTEEMSAWHDELCAPKGGSVASADQIVESLVLFGMGKNPLAAFKQEQVKVGDDVKDYYPWQLESGRSPGWDRRESEAGEEFRPTVNDCAERISTLLGDDSAAESAKRKAGRAKKNASRKR